MNHQASVPVLLLLSGLLIAAAGGDQEQGGPVSPDVVVLEEITDWFGAVDFQHGIHAEIADDCESCHHNSDGELVPCGECHAAEVTVGPTELPNLSLAYHLGCIPCHEAADGPTGCEECHPRRRLPPGPELKPRKTN